jgi:tetratricopeptide (TPR) repeat protein
MRSLVLALAALAASLAACGSLSGWVALWHGARAARAGFANAIRERAAALDADPLSRKSRLLLGEAVARSMIELDRQTIVAMAPRSTIGRVTVAAALDRQGAATEARSLRATITGTGMEEIEVISAADLRTAGLDAANAGRCPEAVPLLDAAVDRGLGDWSLLFKRGACLAQSGSADRALDALLPLYERNRESRWVRLLVAETEARLGHLDTAESVTRTIAWTDPDFYEMWRFAGALLAAEHRPVEAARSFRRALALRPQNTWLRNEIWKQERAAREAAASVTPQRSSPRAPTPRV